MLLSKQQSIGQQAGTAIECPLSGNSRQLGKVITFREMTQDHVGRLTVVFTLKKFRSGLV